jgi:hypothetical protein
MVAKTLPALRRLVWVLVLLVLAVPAPAAESVPISAFFGTFQGQALGQPSDELAVRDLDVQIAAAGNGFRLTWTTTTRDAAGNPKRKAHTIDFQATRRPDIFASQMRATKFGERSPNDPMQGEPFVWARIVDKTLTVYALHIIDDGSYEMQVYDRTLIDGGLALKFSRLREGDKMRTVTATLKKVAR